ncbi:MAG: shikimate dehydrogenase [Gilvibacter sp.]
MATYGLIGKNIEYSFSKEFFARKFELESLAHHYKNFDLPDIAAVKSLLSNNKSVSGFNVTIPYKEEVLSLLDKVDREAKKIGAVNTIKVTNSGQLIGYNTDNYGFAKALVEHFPLSQKQALILGTGGASKAIAYVLKALEIKFKFVSRNPEEGQLGYEQLSKRIIEEQGLIINCTPLGTYPEIDESPNIPYRYLTDKQLLFDLVYNPEVSEFLKSGKCQGSRITNGKQMLVFQAQKSWKIWNS